MSKANGRRIYNPREAHWEPRKEWVELSDGSSLCVWELSVPQTLSLAQAAQRHPEDPRPGGDSQEAAIWQMVYACRAGDESDSPPIFQPQDGPLILAMDPRDFETIMQAIASVSGLTPGAARARRDFTAAPPAASSRG